MLSSGLFCIGLVSLWLPVADVYVDSNAANCVNGTGAIDDPVCRISEGVALASPGDTIRIAPGTYFERVAIGVDLELVGTGGENVTIVDATGLGGSVVTVLAPARVVMDGLTVTGGQALVGGGIRVFGDLVLRNSTVTGNEARGVQARGGGIASQGLAATITIENSTISGNLAHTLYRYNGETAGAALGGGVSARDATLVVRDTTIDSNEVSSAYSPSADSKGAGVHLFRSSLVMSGSTISNNVSGGSGGGVYSRISSFHLTNTTVSSNLAFRASALYTAPPAGPAYLGNVTVTENVPLNGLPVVQVADLTIRNTIIAGNSNPFTVDISGLSLNSLGNNIIGESGAGGVPGVGDIIGTPALPADPLLGPLADNGGPTLTHRLLLGSPAIDAGNTQTFEMLDQRGLQRPLGNAPDIGAFEINLFEEYCFGDGGDQLGCTDCPCSNNALPGTGGGCLNSVGESARLDARGTPSVSQGFDVSIDLRFGLEGVRPNSFCVLTSADTLTPAVPMAPCFGANSGVQSLEFDGLRCVAGNVLRHGGRSADELGEIGVQSEAWGGEGRPAGGIANAMAAFVGGQRRFFQAVYREDHLAGCQRGLNTSQAIEVVFTP